MLFEGSGFPKDVSALDIRNGIQRYLGIMVLVNKEKGNTRCLIETKPADAWLHFARGGDCPHLLQAHVRDRYGERAELKQVEVRGR
ncbi:unnamed protein product [Amoebophrya sp. A120]|nr:unnamed protein product [Amoebophrya sp. A120]|eukprot:GSA120T00012941001.1